MKYALNKETLSLDLFALNKSWIENRNWIKFFLLCHFLEIYKDVARQDRILQYKSFILFSATNFGNSILYLCKARGPGLGFEMALKIWETVQFDLKTEAMAWWANWHWKVEFNVPDLSIKTMATHNLFIGGFYVQKIFTILKLTLTPVYFQKECIMFWLL